MSSSVRPTVLKQPILNEELNPMNINSDLLLTQIINVIVGATLPIILILVVFSLYRRFRNMENRITDLEKEMKDNTSA